MVQRFGEKNVLDNVDPKAAESKVYKFDIGAEGLGKLKKGISNFFSQIKSPHSSKMLATPSNFSKVHTYEYYTNTYNREEVQKYNRNKLNLKKTFCTIIQNFKKYTDYSKEMIQNYF